MGVLVFVVVELPVILLPASLASSMRRTEIKGDLILPEPSYILLVLIQVILAKALPDFKMSE